MLCCSVVSILSGLVAALSPLVEVYIFLMVVTLTGVTGLYISSFTLLMETCGRKERSSIGVLFVIPWSLGYMIVPGIAYLIRPWKWLLVALSLPSLPLLLNFWLLPESPRWLILQGKHKEALKVLKSAAMVNGKTLPSEERLLATMQLLQTKVSAEGKASVPKESVAKSKRRPAADRVVEVVKEYLVIVMRGPLPLHLPGRSARAALLSPAVASHSLPRTSQGPTAVVSAVCHRHPHTRAFNVLLPYCSYRDTDALLIKREGGHHDGFPLALGVHSGAVSHQLPLPRYLTGQPLRQDRRRLLSLHH
ncbi:organic cation transporter protein-like [Scylla paramamosain]|uniref:organic cation transporter protein-like n=1 Tax=Scylla paramamosain TaxID=85552 RepID=UPI003082757D